MSAFTGHHAIPIAIPEKDGLPEASPSGQQGARRSLHRSAGIQHHEIFWGKMLQAVTSRTEIVHQRDRLDAEFL